MIELASPDFSFGVEIHESLWAGLCDAVGIPRTSTVLGPGEAALLDEWADASPNPTGQRANLARGIAALVRVGTLTRRNPGVARGFWEATA